MTQNWKGVINLEAKTDISINYFTLALNYLTYSLRSPELERVD